MSVIRESSPAAPRKWPAVLAWALWSLAIISGAVIWWVYEGPLAGHPEIRDAGGIPPTIALLSATTAGAVLATLRPRHPVGWVLLGFSLSLGVSGLAEAYGDYGVLGPPDALPAVSFIALLSPIGALAAMTCIGFVVALTPTGSLPSARWRWWAGVAVAPPLISLVAVMLCPTPQYRVLDNPFDFRAHSGALRITNEIALILSIVGVLLAPGSLVARFRRAHGVERLQLRWVSLAASGAWVMAAVCLGGLLFGEPAVLGWAAATYLAILPMAIGAAILRYRLYDLDRIISRAVAYGVITVTLGLSYAGVIVALGELLGRGSSVAVAIATLTVAAAFQPVRRRVQQRVDRRFNRRRYDAAKTIDAFTTRLRQEVDLDTLTGELMAVVRDTMQPSQLSLWVRPQPANGLRHSERVTPGEIA